MTLATGERWEEEREQFPGLVGDDLRLQYLVYNGTPPADDPSSIVIDHRARHSENSSNRHGG